MKSVARMELQPGMILGEDVCIGETTLFQAGDVLDKSKIEKLKHYSIMCVIIKEDIDFASSHFQKLRFSEDFLRFEQKQQENLYRYKKLMDYFLRSRELIPAEAFLDLYKDMRATYSNGSVLLDYLYNLVPNEEQMTFHHGLNSVLLGGIFAEWIHMSEKERNQLILACFYYDIGKLMLPYEILWKPGKLTDEEYALVKKHPILGYSILKNYSAIDQQIKNAVILHHERMDGSGYPYHMKGEAIEPLARYIAVIDTYIAMASARSYREAFTPLQIVAHFEQNLTKYDTAILIPLLKHIADAQIGSMVRLSDDSVWEVMIINPGKMSRPILKNDTGLLNLTEHPDLEIVKIV